jgi:two-component system, cell cycle sensor histidine kinase and response regulator CckA
LEQVLLNLCVNSRGAMPNGGKLTIETGAANLDEHYAAAHPGTQPGSYVLLSVTATGVGMDAETQTRVFEPFFTTKERGKGTGLGLATAFGIVKQHGGSIWLYSERDKGSTFKIYLPEVKGGTREPVTVAQRNAGPAQGETILVIEDEKAVRELVCRMLFVMGYTVLEARGATEGFEIAAQAERIDLLLTDVIMPDMNGRQAYEHIAAQRPGLKVLYMSGYTENGIVHRGILDEGVHFISKPFSEGLLSRKIREILEEL